jgi:HK97 family phage major capsid protein
VTSFDFNTVEFGFYKAAAISVMTEELLRFSSPAADALVRDGMVGALVERLDADFILASKSAVAGVSPASVTNGLTAVAASGTDADAARFDIKALLTKFVTAKIGLSSGVWVMHPSMALSLSMMVNALGNPDFPGVTMMGGTLMGMPVITSENALSTTIALIAADEVYIAMGGVMVDSSNQASIEMNTAPTGNSGTPTASSLVSLFQTNSVALRVEQFANWQRRRADGVAIITGAAYTP